MSPAAIEAAFRAACLAELQALKPGNVHVHADGHGMTVAAFEASAVAAAPWIGRAGAPVGERILGAIEATHAAVGCNTNLGIVLLSAPLARAAEAAGGAALRPALERVLDGLNAEDAARAYRAIRLAAPAGLGTSPEHDVHAEPRVGLREAMHAGAGRDRIAAQYAHGFTDVFAVGVARLDALRRRGWPEPWAVTGCYLAFLAAFADSHVVRKQGRALAEAVRRRAAEHAAALERGDWVASSATLLAWDAELKRDGVNPGTSADLTVATLFAAALDRSRSGC